MKILTLFSKAEKALTTPFTSHRAGYSVRPLPKSLHVSPLYSVREIEGEHYVYRNDLRVKGPLSAERANEICQALIENVAFRSNAAL